MHVPEQCFQRAISQTLDLLAMRSFVVNRETQARGIGSRRSNFAIMASIAAGTFGDMHHLERRIRQIVDGHRVVRSPTTHRPVYLAHEIDHHITTSGRRALPAQLFALPASPAEARRGIAGRVPFDTIGRARSGLARLSMMRHQGTITDRQLARARQRILAHWPEID